MSDYLSSFYPPPPTLRHLTFNKTLPYSPSRVFAVLSDIASYHEFSTLIISSDVTAKDPHHLPKSAKLKVGYPPLGLEEEWQCNLSCSRESGIVEARSGADGTATFETWVMKWRIQPSPSKAKESGEKKTTVRLDLEIKFRSTMVDQVFAQLEAGVAERMMLKFERRIAEVDERERKKQAQAEKSKESAKVETSAKEVGNKAKQPPRKLEVRSGKKAQAPAA